MRKQLFYWLDEHQIDDVEEIKQLNSLLCNHGITIKLKEHKSGKGILFSYDTEEIKEKLKRNAGRHPVACDYDVTIEDIRERMKNGESAEIIASQLGISRSTFFRKLKYAEEHDIMFL